MLVPRRLQAPGQDGAVVAEPSLAEVGRILAVNRQRLGGLAGGLLGRSWEDLRHQARQSAVAAAANYLREAGEAVPAFGDDSLLMSGHQPELFHPGVWVKNFALHHLAKVHKATPINLVVDNDTAKSASLHLPPPVTEKIAATEFFKPLSIPFDNWTEDIPYEERTIRDEDLWSTFPERVAAVTGNWNFKPLLGEFWEEVKRQGQRTPLLGERFAAARRTCERRWGCHNLEVPVSRLCRTEPFALFACHVLADLPRFHAAYNACVHDYRRLYGIRSRHHPVPDLAAEKGWLEVPFWAWHPERPRRGRLMARLGSNGVELRIGTDLVHHLPPISAHDPGAALSTWQRLEDQGFKIRSRALTNTIYCRLFLADLFIHGIGGGKYDELTDEIIRRFYGFEPPAYLVLSATLLLPLPSFPVQPQEEQQLARQLRDLHCNPQRHLVNGTPIPAGAADLAAQKRFWIDRQPGDRSERRQRFQVLKNLTEQLRPFLAEQEEHLQETLARYHHQVQANAILRRRDYAFCLFPEKTVEAFCKRFL